jgi:bifunctional DNase/RNase
VKCNTPDCSEDATVHILEVKDRRLLDQKDVCEEHKWKERPFCDPGSGITSSGPAVTGGISPFDLCFVAFFDRREADSLFLHEVSGKKRFSIPVYRHQAYAIMEALQKTGEYSRPFTFTAFATILQSVGIQVEEVIVDEIEGHGKYYHAKIKLHHANRMVVLDVRPSDAFGLAISCHAPILIADNVLARASELGWTQPPSK